MRLCGAEMSICSDFTDIPAGPRVAFTVSLCTASYGEILLLDQSNICFRQRGFGRKCLTEFFGEGDTFGWPGSPFTGSLDFDVRGSRRIGGSSSASWHTTGTPFCHQRLLR